MATASAKARDRERARQLSMWRWDALEAQWVRVNTPRPGEMLWVHADVGGYDPDLGWTGELLKQPVPAIEAALAEEVSASYGGDSETAIGRWVRLVAHLRHVEAESRLLTGASEAVAVAARWHDVGKAHSEFQDRLVAPVADDESLCAPDDGPWAKSSHRRSWRDARPFFRHELVSALAWLEAGGEDDQRRCDLIAYLIAAHHGKIRVSIRSLPGERKPPDGRLHARGVWDGDELPAVELPDGTTIGPLILSLDLMRLGAGSWVERVVSLRDDPELGPFRLAYLESLVRVADWRASAREKQGDYDD